MEPFIPPPVPPPFPRPWPVHEAVRAVQQPQPPHEWDERALAWLGGRQDRLVTVHQLDVLGLSPAGRKWRLGQRRLVVAYPGVYIVGGAPLDERGRLRAAVWSCGPGAQLSHRSGARLRGWWDWPIAQIDVTVPRPHRPRHKSLRIHQTGVRLQVDEDEVHGIPCTSVARLIVDLAGSESEKAVHAVFWRAERDGRIDVAAIESVLERRRRAPGAAVVRELLETHRPGVLPRSGSERRLLVALRRGGIAEPLVNQQLDLGGEISRPDLMWPERRLIVEYDGFETHDGPVMEIRDRRDDRQRTKHGWRFLRYTRHELDHDLDGIVTEVREALRATLPPQPPHGR